MDEVELADVAVAPNEVLADIICSMLRAEGIDCTQRLTDLGSINPILGMTGGRTLKLIGAMGGASGALGEFGRGSGGMRVVTVRAQDAERARELVASEASDVTDWNGDPQAGGEDAEL